MAFALKFYGSAPLWGVNFAKSPIASGAAVITSATFSTSTQKYETVNELGAKIGALVYDSECSFSIQTTLLATAGGDNCGNPAGCSPATAPFRHYCCNEPGFSANMCGNLALVAAPAWMFAAEDGASLYPVIDSAEFAMSNTSARTASISGTIYAF